MTNFWQALENLGGTAMESAVIQEPERRLYYDKNGDVITYTTEDLDGEYIVVDQSTYQQARTDLKIKDEKIIRITRGSSWKIKPNNIKSIPIHPKDVSIVVNSKYENPSYWQVVTTHEAE